MMRCQICKTGKMYVDHTGVTLPCPSGARLVFKNVPIRICQNCGEGFIRESIMARMMEVAHLAANARVKVKADKIVVHRKLKVPAGRPIPLRSRF